jgi:hypothetical protein
MQIFRKACIGGFMIGFGGSIAWEGGKILYQLWGDQRTPSEEEQRDTKKENGN